MSLGATYPANTVSHPTVLEYSIILMWELQTQRLNMFYVQLFSWKLKIVLWRGGGGVYTGKYCTFIKLFSISLMFYHHSPDLPCSHIFLLSLLLTLTGKRRRNIASFMVFVHTLLVLCQRAVYEPPGKNGLAWWFKTEINFCVISESSGSVIHSCVSQLCIAGTD